MKSLTFVKGKPIKEQLNHFFKLARAIDYQAVFEGDFTDSIPFNKTMDELLYNLIQIFETFDFKISRNLGALDLNADFFKNKMRMFNPGLLTDKQKDNIIEKFRPLSARPIKNYDQEYQQKDRKEFDEGVLKAFGFEADILPPGYSLKKRVNIKRDIYR